MLVVMVRFSKRELLILALHLLVTVARLFRPGGVRAVAESFFSSLKKQRVRKRIYKTRDLITGTFFTVSILSAAWVLSGIPCIVIRLDDFPGD
jgi:hypothetical protein